jgi:hypothetical protein
VATGTDAEALLFERLENALAPEYVLKREVARGGMGVVYLAHDVALDRPVAVKLLAPEHATAELAARFLREAQVLARLHHPNIVTVHRVSEKSGLFYYIMEWLDGESLQERLARGPLPLPQVVRIGSELLAALGEAHRQRWIHRDVKPGNIFLSDNRAILTDFGIARTLDPEAETLTETRQTIGTLAYMSPEQREGGHVSEASDIYSAGLVLYEAACGRRWWQRDQDSHEWSGVPSRLRRVLRKAMEHNPANRWASAQLFGEELNRRAKPSLAPLLWAGGALLIATALYFSLRPSGAAPPTSGRTVRLQAFESIGPGGWGDSLGRAIAASLASFPDLVVTGPDADAGGSADAALVFIGSVEATGPTLRATVGTRPGTASRISVTQEGKAAEWRTLADSLAAQLIYAIYVSDPHRDLSLPTAVLPQTPAGWHAWSQAEPLFTQARWGEAAIAYRSAEALDSTCLLCAFRINDIDRWLDQPHDPSRVTRLRDHAGEFPAHYQLLIQAATTQWPARIALMDSATRTRDFFLANFHKGDEIFHRGPLFGRHRSEAMADFERAVSLRPDFAPAWEHLAWIRIAEGDSVGAAHALDSLELTGEVVDPTAVGLRFLLKAAFAYKFLPPGTGDAIVTGALTMPEVASFPYLAMAPRLMLTFEAPEAAIGMGRIFARRSAVAEIRSGLLAQVFGHLALGRSDSAQHYARSLQNRVRGINTDLFAAQLAGALVLVDPDSLPEYGTRARLALEYLKQFSLSEAVGDAGRHRAGWMVALLAQRTHYPAGMTAAGPLALDGSDSVEARHYLALIQADRLASGGQYDQALRLTNWNPEDLVRLSDPFFSAVTHFFRADWFARQGNALDAVATLLWHEANDFGTYPTGEPLPPEVDQAFGTLAQWKQAQLLAASAAMGLDPCPSYRAVARRWRGGDSLHQARAAFAANRLSWFSCGDG